MIVLRDLYIVLVFGYNGTLFFLLQVLGGLGGWFCELRSVEMILKLWLLMIRLSMLNTW